jgi:hypothetical protein
MSKAQSGFAGTLDLLNKSIHTGVVIFSLYFRVKCFTYPATKDILGMNQSIEAFAVKESEAAKNYRKVFSDIAKGPVGKITRIHVKDVFVLSAAVGYNLCDFFPRYSVVADIVDALVDVVAQSKDESGAATEASRTHAAAFAFANYAASHYMKAPDRREAWSDFADQARLNGVSFDRAVEIYETIYKSFIPEHFTRNDVKDYAPDMVVFGI